MDFPGTDLEIKIMLSTGGRGSRNAFACSIFSRFVRHTRVGRDPVGFPGLAAIVRKRLFEAAGIGGDVRNDKADINGAAIERFLVEKFTAAIFELADGWLAQCATVAVRKI